MVSSRIELEYQVPETCVLSIVLRDQNGTHESAIGSCAFLHQAFSGGKSTLKSANPPRKVWKSGQIFIIWKVRNKIAGMLPFQTLLWYTGTFANMEVGSKMAYMFPFHAFPSAHEFHVYFLKLLGLCCSFSVVILCSTSYPNPASVTSNFITQP